MGFYSFIVISPDEMPLPEHRLYLDRGRNVFNALIEDIDAFKTKLSSGGVNIIQVNRLDVFEKVPRQLSELPVIESDPFDDAPLLPGQGSGTGRS
jgi:hypothetical protein